MQRGNDRRREAIDDPELWRYVRADGRLAAMPRRRELRVRLLAHLAQRFERGRDYSEADVNRILEGFDADFAMLRRYLIDERLLTRERDRYRRV